MTTTAPPFSHRDEGTPEAVWAEAPQWSEVPELPTLKQGRTERLVVVSAHPDDESLGAGGLIALADSLEIPVHVVLLTAGERSHPDSPTHSAQRLATLRLGEFERALAELAPLASTTFVGLSDGAVDAGEETGIEALVDVIGTQGESTLVLAPWRRDGHTDHEAAGRIAAIAVERTDAELLEYPIWWWHWGAPHVTPWSQLVQLPLTPRLRSRKTEALAHYRSQSTSLSDLPGDEAVLEPEFLSHFARDHEVFVLPPGPGEDTAFDDLHADDPDPWSVTTRWYEQRKRAVTLAALTRARYRRALEIGCSIGALAADLAPRCDELIAVDRSAAAVARAAETLSAHEGARAARMTVPEEWPEGTFDLVVVSESGYFLSPRQLSDTIARIRDSLSSDGAVLLCHWRHPIAGWPLDGDDVHTIVMERSGLTVCVEHRERDFLLHLLGRSGEDDIRDGA